MRKETSELTISLVEALTNGQWAVRWDFKEKLNTNGESTGLYWYEEYVYNHIPLLDEIKMDITEWLNKLTDCIILLGLTWKGNNVLLNEENKFNFKSLFDLVVMFLPLVVAWDNSHPELSGKDFIIKEITDDNNITIQIPEPTGRPKSILPITLKLGTNENPNFYLFTTIEELTDFYMEAVNWTLQCYNSGWVKNREFDYTPYQECIDKLMNL